jgi:hypothetical protein
MSFSNGPTVVTNGLVLALDAGDRNSYVSGSTTWIDLAGTNNGTLTNGPTFNSGSGGSIVFDGSNDYVNVSSSNSLNITGDLTLTCWIYCTGRSGFYRTIISKNYALDNPTYEIGVASINKLYWYGNGIAKFGPTTINLNQWYNLSVTINSTAKTGVLYINGNVELNMSGLATQLTGSNPLYIGVDAPTGVGEQSFFIGSISSTQIYNKALSASEVLQNYNAQKSKFGL